MNWYYATQISGLVLRLVGVVVGIEIGYLMYLYIITISLHC